VSGRSVGGAVDLALGVGVDHPCDRACCTGSTTAPTSMHLSSGSPTRSLSIRALSRVWKSSAMPSCTKSREPAQQTCPWLNQMASTRPSMALSISASSKTM
jgi:hypothetical protein